MDTLPPGVDVNNLINDLRILSWEVSEILLYYSKIIKDSSEKNIILENDNADDPVTLADIKVNEIIIERINEKYKGINWGVLSEENVKIESDNSVLDHDWVWVLDPLDGTKDFIQGTGNYAMHLALNYKNKSCIGVVLIPEKNELWLTNGKETWCEEKDGSKKGLNIVKRHQKKSLKEMILVTSKNHRNEILRKLIQKVYFKKVIVMGSIGCKLASILRGESDIYISLSLPGQSSPKDWDFAAPEAVLRNYGGTITNLDNEDLIYGSENYEQGGIIVASNNKQHHKFLCLELKEIINKFDIYP